MKKYSLLIVMLLQMVFAMAQSITVTFTAQNQNGNYCQLDAVNITNITQNWSQTLTYPDTTIVLNYIDGMAETSVAEGFMYNRPNPFHGTTDAVLNLFNGGQTHIQLVNTKGMVLAECDASLPQGEHVIKVNLAEPQLALLCARTETGFYALKILNIGQGACNSVDVVGSLKSTKSGPTRADGIGQFLPGDEMSYSGLMLLDGTMVMSDVITQTQYSDEVINFEFNTEPVVPEGAINGLFTISNTEKAYFSQGNLQYQASTDTWRFAENQWDYIGVHNTVYGAPAGGTVEGSDNSSICDENYEGWIDLFGWGTGDHPTSYEEDNSLYSVFTDWGSNPISNGGNEPDKWSTLTKEEWEYLLFDRNTVSGKLYVLAKVNDVSGLLLLPDDWETSFYTFDSGNNETIISLSDWSNVIEPHGAVFLPAAGYRHYRIVAWAGWNKYYWTSTPPQGYDESSDYYNDYAYYFDGNSIDFLQRNIGCAVRLVRKVTPQGFSLPTVITSEQTASICTRIVSGGTVVDDGGSEVVARGICYSLESSNVNPTLANAYHSVNGSGLGSFESGFNLYSSGGNLIHVRAYATNSSGTAYGEVKHIVTQGFCVPFVTTGFATQIMSTTAICAGEVTNSSGLDVTERGICFSKTNTQPTIENSYYIQSGSGLGSFECMLSSLEPNTTYFYCAYATNDVGTGYGTVLHFTTDPVYYLPTVTTNSAVGVTPSSAMCGGNVTSDGGSSVYERGICYSSYNTQPTISDSYVVSGSGTGLFTATITGLNNNVTYYYRAYAINAAGIAYGQVLSFTTGGSVTIPSVITTAATSITSSSAVCGGNVVSDGGSSVYERGVCYSNTSTIPTLSNTHISSGSGVGVYTVSLTGLTSNATYYIRAYATNSEGTCYGEILSFTTTGGGTPSDPNALSGLFSVSATRKVNFSKGNLQYKPSTASWRFAPNQYDVIGSDNSNISSSYSGYIDLFGWGTSGYSGCMPYQTELSMVYGGNLSSIANTNYDWGVYNMSGYRTLTADEWNYLLSERDNALDRKAPAKVNNVCGWILLPDNWNNTSYGIVTYEDGARNYSANVISVSQWSNLQSAGAVFLPAAGWRYSSGSSSITAYVNSQGYYWSTTSQDAVAFATNYCYSGETVATYTGCAVRLVCNAQ